MPSYSPVFSEQFILYTDTSGATAFEVPASFTAVLRDASAYATIGGAEVTFSVQNSEDAPQVVVAQVNPAGIAAYDQWQGRVVIPEGGLLTLQEAIVGLGLEIYAGGYLLRNTLT